MYTYIRKGIRIYVFVNLYVYNYIHACVNVIHICIYVCMCVGGCFCVREYTKTSTTKTCMWNNNT